MAKMRGFKPELWTDEKFVEASPLARLLFLGLWTYSCDNGHLKDRSKSLKMRILPADQCNVSQLLDELADIGLIQRADGWIHIPKLGHHQRIDQRFFLTCGKERDDCIKPQPATKPTQTKNPQRETRRAHAVDTR